MKEIYKLFKYFIYIKLIRIIISLRYPINKNLDNSTGKQELIEIETRASYVNYTKYNKAISIFHTNYCGYCYFLIEIFKWASSYSSVSDWKFLSVNCTRKQLICKFYNITKLPTIKTYLYNKTELPYEAPYELIPFLEYLIKLSNSPIIDIVENSTKNQTKNLTNFLNISEFYKNYGYFSPLVEYNHNESEFYNCITNLANNKYRTIFYFGMKKTNNKDEKIIIDNEGAPFSFIWEGNCQNVDLFLDKHIFPLITIIDENIFFYNLNKKKKILVMLFGFLINNDTKNFVNNEYKLLAYQNNKLIFCFLNYSNTSEINRYFHVKLYANSELKFIIFDFSKSIYYIHPIIYDVNYNKPEEIYSDLNKILNNLLEIKFTTGYFFKDLLIKFGFKEFTTILSIVLVIFIIIVSVLISFICTLFCKKVCPSEIEENENFEQNNEDKDQKINNKKNENKNEKLKKE